MTPVVHCDSATRPLTTTPPIGIPLRHALRMGRSKRVEHHRANASDGAGRDDATDGRDDGSELVVVAREEYALRGDGLVEKRRRIHRVRGQRLLAQHVEMPSQRLLGNRRVRGRRRCDVDEVQARTRGEQGFDRLEEAGLREGLRREPQASIASIDYGHDVDVVALLIR